MVCLIAAVSSYLALYERIPWWDLPVHLALTGLLAVLAARAVRTRSPTATEIVATGAALAVVWEGMELAGSTWIDSSIHVTPRDTILDITAGLVGTAATALLWRRRECEPRSRPRYRSTHQS